LAMRTRDWLLVGSAIAVIALLVLW
jgi:hypothetical protein